MGLISAFTCTGKKKKKRENEKKYMEQGCDCYAYWNIYWVVCLYIYTFFIDLEESEENRFCSVAWYL
jgi:hypothetical protein